MFQVVISSDCDQGTQPENHGGDFKCTLNQTLDVSKGMWSVALAELFITPNSWAVIREPYNVISLSISDLQVKKLTFHRSEFDGVIHIPKPFGIHSIGKIYVKNPDHYKTRVTQVWVGDKYILKEYHSYQMYKDLVVYNEIIPDTYYPHIKNSLYRGHYYNYVVQGETIWYGTEFPTPIVTHSEIPPGNYTEGQLLTALENACVQAFIEAMNIVAENKVLITLEASAYIHHELGVRKRFLDYAISSAGVVEIGFTQDLRELFNPSILLTKQVSYLLGLTKSMIEIPDWFQIKTGVIPPNVNANTFPYFWVCVDCIEPTAINDKHAKILRLIQCNLSNGQIQYETFHRLNFKPICVKSIREIRIWFSESQTGEPPILLRNPSTISLIFKNE
jgi:hypothetical protein